MVAGPGSLERACVRSFTRPVFRADHAVGRFGSHISVSVAVIVWCLMIGEWVGQLRLARS